MKQLKLYCIMATAIIYISSYAQESGGGGTQTVTPEKKGTNGLPQFHPRGFYMTFGYAFDRGNASGTYVATNVPQIGQPYSYSYIAHGVAFDFGGKIFNKKKLANKFQIGADIASTSQFCFVTLFSGELDHPYLMYWGIKTGPSFAWNFNNTRFIFITPMVGIDYFSFSIIPTYDGSSYPWEVSRYTWDAGFGISAGLKVEYVLKRFAFGTSCFYLPTFAYTTIPNVISRVQYSAFIGFKLSNPIGKK